MGRTSEYRPLDFGGPRRLSFGGRRGNDAFEQKPHHKSSHGMSEECDTGQTRGRRPLCHLLLKIARSSEQIDTPIVGDRQIGTVARTVDFAANISEIALYGAVY